MPLTPDRLLTSCHPNIQEARWVKRKGRLVCSKCGSMHPDEFAENLAAAFKQGWIFSSKQPIRCEFDDGSFFLRKHIEDMPMAWLAENREQIALITGVVFYWRRERLQWKQIAQRTRKKGEVLSDVELAKLSKIIENIVEDN